MPFSTRSGATSTAVENVERKAAWAAAASAFLLATLRLPQTGDPAQRLFFLPAPVVLVRRTRRARRLEGEPY